MMFFTRNEAAVTWVTPALLGLVLGILAYAGVDLPSASPLLAGLFAVIGMVVCSVIAYGFRRFLMPPHGDDFDEEA